MKWGCTVRTKLASDRGFCVAIDVSKWLPLSTIGVEMRVEKEREKQVEGGKKEGMW